MGNYISRVGESITTVIKYIDTNKRPLKRKHDAIEIDSRETNTDDNDTDNDETKVNEDDDDDEDDDEFNDDNESSNEGGGDDGDGIDDDDLSNEDDDDDDDEDDSDGDESISDGGNHSDLDSGISSTCRRILGNNSPIILNNNLTQTSTTTTTTNNNTTSTSNPATIQHNSLSIYETTIQNRQNSINTTTTTTINNNNKKHRNKKKSKSSKLNNKKSKSSKSSSSNKQTSTPSKKQKKEFKSIDRKLKTPTRKKMKSTSTYIYNTLYLKGESSDIVVRALNKEWKLHKIYLCQSPYFSSMLQGSWKESQETYIDIEIPDRNISERALFIAFGSLYKDDFEIAPIDVIEVLACASLFCLDSLLNECTTIMLENINIKTVYSYYDAAQSYGLKLLGDKTLQWFCFNIMTCNDIKYNLIDTCLFHKIITSKQLMIIQVETDLYTLCKKWLFFNLNPKHKLESINNKQWQKSANEFFHKYLQDNNLEYLLDAPEMQPYVSIFEQIRLQHIITDLSSLKIIINDRIIPRTWIEPQYRLNWLNTLYVDQHNDSVDFETNEIDFERECVRFGRMLNEDVLYTWRWVGFHFGIDLLVTYMHHSFTLKRNTLYIYSPYKGLLSNRPTQRIYYVISVAQLDKFGNCKWFKRSEFTCLDLHRNEEKFVFSLDSSIEFPLIMNLHISCHPSSSINLIIENNNNNSNLNATIATTNDMSRSSVVNNNNNNNNNSLTLSSSPTTSAAAAVASTSS